MFDWQIPLFPFDSSSVTITTTVWIGVVITAFFNLRFGWTLSALVIPGYIVPLMMARPMSAAIILVESVITYGIAIWISEANRKQPYWSSLFGRDRFFLIVVISVLVRSLCDGWMLPASGRWLVENWNLDIDYRNDLNSLGLIAVSLIANYFWKPGLKAGLPCLLTSVGLTWAIVTWVLVPFTNFNIGSFHLLYEDISASMLASPKAYMIILVTGWLASWINLRYAWDFNGILIPALVAMLWTNPERIVISLMEATVILLLGKLILSTSLFRNLAMQGGRKLAFFFTICFLFRFTLAHSFSLLQLDLKVTDYFGLGYLLTTLIAIKFHDKKLPVRMTKGVLQVSAVGAVVACVAGFIVDRVEIFGARDDQVRTLTVADAAVIETNKTIFELFKVEKVRLFRDMSNAAVAAISKEELGIFRSALLRLKQVTGEFTNRSNQELIREAAQLLNRVNYELAVVGGDKLLLRQREPFEARGWFLVSPGQTGLAIVADNAVEEKWSGESAVYFHQQLGAGAVAIANNASHRKTGRPSSNETLTFESTFNEVFAIDEQLQVRTQRPDVANRLEQNLLAVHGSIPASIDLPLLKELLGGFQFRWNAKNTISNVAFKRSDLNEQASATIWLSNDSLRKIVGRMNLDSRAQQQIGKENLFVKCALPAWLSSVQERILDAGTNQYVAPKEEELLFLDRSILQPMIELAKEGFSRSSLLSFKAIDDEARSVGYCVQVIEDENSGEHFVALREQDSPVQRRGWGTVLFKFGLEQPWGVEIPRPNLELRSFEFGANIFQRPGASSLCIAGAHPWTNTDGSSDLTKSANRGNLLNLARHIIFRELKDRPWLMVQTRSIKDTVESDIVVATANGTTRMESLSETSRCLCDSFVADGLSVEFVDGREEVAGYELGHMLRVASAQFGENKEVMTFWVSPDLRSKFRQQDPNDNLNAQLMACGLESTFATRQEFVAAVSRVKTATELPDALKTQLLKFSDDHDVVRLFSTIKKFDNFRFVRFFDDQTKTTLIVVLTGDNQLVALLNPRGIVDRVKLFKRMDLNVLHEFILSRAQLLEVKP